MGRNSRTLGLGSSAQMPNSTTNSASYLRQQMDESNHDMVQMLAQTMGTIFNPLIQNTTQSNLQLAAQMTCIADFFGVPQPPRQPQREFIRENQGLVLGEDVTINQTPQNVPQNVVNQRVAVEQPVVEPPRVVPQLPRAQEPRVVMVNRNQNADEVVQHIRRDNIVADNNLAAMVERIMAQNGVNFGLRRPNYTSPLSEYILQSELPPRWKVPKFTKFSGDTTESTVEHVARYLMEVGEISNNENLRIKYFPSALTKMLSLGLQLCHQIRSTIGPN